MLAGRCARVLAWRCALVIPWRTIDGEGWSLDRVANWILDRVRGRIQSGLRLERGGMRFDNEFAAEFDYRAARFIDGLQKHYGEVGTLAFLPAGSFCQVGNRLSISTTKTKV